MAEKFFTPEEEEILRAFGRDLVKLSEQMAREKERNLQATVEQIESEKSKYSSFGGDCATCSLEIPDYLKHNTI